MNKKMNNKGFSLVELIVVIAVMGILAVTLAPRLTSYIEKTRKASDKEIANTIMTAARYALVDEDILEAFIDDTDGVATETGTGTGVFRFHVKDMYTVTDNTEWAVNRGYADIDNLFIQEIVEVVGDFDMRSDDVGAHTDFIIELDTDSDVLLVGLDYDLFDGGSAETSPITYHYETTSRQ